MGWRKPLTKKMITVGTIMSAPIDYRRIVKEALNCNATAIILFHNPVLHKMWGLGLFLAVD